MNILQVSSMVRCLMGAARLNLLLSAAVAISLSGGVCHAYAGSDDDGPAADRRVRREVLPQGEGQGACVLQADACGGCFVYHG